MAGFAVAGTADWQGSSIEAKFAGRLLQLRGRCSRGPTLDFFETITRIYKRSKYAQGQRIIDKVPGIETDTKNTNSARMSGSETKVTLLTHTHTVGGMRVQRRERRQHFPAKNERKERTERTSCVMQQNTKTPTA
jgi:hypothetical protein